MQIPRLLYQTLLTHLETSEKGILLYGPRQVGKTTLVRTIIQKLSRKTLTINADERGPWWDALVSRERIQIDRLVSDNELIFIDEAQRIPEIGLSLKIIRDAHPSVRLIVTGSSSLDLASKVSEPLTGRVYSWRLFPISQGELPTFCSPLELDAALDERLVFGSYPEIFSIPGADGKGKYLQNVVNSYLYRDLLEFGEIRNSSKIFDLLKLLAFQIGSQVSVNELSQSLELSRATVDRYIDLLEKSFVIFRVHGFSRNLRKEVTKMDKIYFYDTGVRNAIIGNLQSVSDRNDGGALWENFLIIERMKRLEYSGEIYSHAFWRLSSGAELDLVEESDGDLHGFEMKYSQKLSRAPASWAATYPKASYTVVNRNSWQDFVLSR